ncbi:hypothetical protein GLYMA_19G221050v4 [Glycine max]|nr:hypothetical protein GLYMA_19G221050v4 [Glycine max]KAH1079046.1 hypothetical protein GYH30_053879 [Glycine max]
MLALCVGLFFFFRSLWGRRWCTTSTTNHRTVGLAFTNNGCFCFFFFSFLQIYNLQY